MFSNFFSLENRAVYEIMWKNIVEPGGPQMPLWAHAHCKLDTSGYKICKTDFPLQQWLHERT